MIIQKYFFATMKAPPHPVSYNQAVPETKIDGFTPIYRQKNISELVATPHKHVQTVRDIIIQCRDLFGGKKGLGQIIVTSQKGEKGEDIELRSIKEYTYQEIFERALNLGKALMDRKLDFQEPQRAMKLIGIFSKNRLEWFETDWACALFGLTTVPLYDTLGRDSLAYCIEMTGITTMFVSAKTAGEMVKFNLKGTLKTIISYDPLDGKTSKMIKEMGLELLHYSDLIEEGAKSDLNFQNFEVKPQDIYSFCYTSGTTGKPKAAMISHQNLLAALAAFILHKELGFRPEDVYLSYLPLPHLMERTIANCIFYSGGFLVNSSGNTLKIKEDTAAIKATIFISVPRVFSRIVDAVNTTINSMVTDESEREAITRAVYEKVKQSYGGHIRIMATGSAPITAKVQQTMQKIMGCPLIEGYGQTEATCALVFSRATDTDFTVMHELSPACEVKLCDIPEMNYTSKDLDSEGRPIPRGQIWARGPQIFVGYYKQEDLNKETITPEGWVKTGDVGLITQNLGLKIIDRKKNIFKLQQGEYVTPDKVERAYLKTAYVEQVFLHGTSIYPFAVAIATPNRQKIQKIASQIGVEGHLEQLCKSQAVRTQFLTELNLLARQQGVLGFELAKNICLVYEGFAAKGIFTNTMKLMRFQARSYFKDQIEVMYTEGELTP